MNGLSIQGIKPSELLSIPTSQLKGDEIITISCKDTTYKITLDQLRIAVRPSKRDLGLEGVEKMSKDVEALLNDLSDLMKQESNSGGETSIIALLANLSTNGGLVVEDQW